MNRNEAIGTFIGTTLGYAVQGVILSKLLRLTNIRSGFMVKILIKWCFRLVKYISKIYVRTDFRSETIFSEAIDASFFAD